MSLAAEGFGEVLDEGDQSARHAAQDVEIALLNTQAQALPVAQLTDAESGAVLCWECEKPILPERLAALPTAAFCVPCLQAIEHRRKLRREGAA